MTDKLTKRQRWWLEHVRRATGSGETLKAYARSHGISLSGLYDAKFKFSRCGLFVGKGVEGRKRQPSAFVPVQLDAALPVRSACRLTHTSGWVVECEGLPEPGWLLALLKSGG